MPCVLVFHRRDVLSPSTPPPRSTNTLVVLDLLDPVLEGIADQLLLPTEMQLAQDVPHVVFDGLLAAM